MATFTPKFVTSILPLNVDTDELKFQTIWYNLPSPVNSVLIPFFFMGLVVPLAFIKDLI